MTPSSPSSDRGGLPGRRPTRPGGWQGGCGERRAPPTGAPWSRWAPPHRGSAATAGHWSSLGPSGWLGDVTTVTRRAPWPPGKLNTVPEPWPPRSTTPRSGSSSTSITERTTLVTRKRLRVSKASCGRVSPAGGNREGLLPQRGQDAAQPRPRPARSPRPQPSQCLF